MDELDLSIKRETKPCPLCEAKGRCLECVVCRGTGLVYVTPKTEQNKRRNAKYTKQAKKEHKHFNKYEKNFLANPEYSSAELARKFKRSLKSIESARYRLRKKENDGKQPETD